MLERKYRGQRGQSTRLSSLSIKKTKKEKVYMVQFFQTHMGQKFYERDIPEMVRKLNEIASELSRSVLLQSFPSDPL